MTMRSSSYYGSGRRIDLSYIQPPQTGLGIGPGGDLLAKHKYDEALSTMRPLLEHYPYAAPLYSLMAIAYDNSGRHREALDKVIPAIVLMPGTAQFWNVGARIAYTNDCESDAILMEAIARTILE
jgi:Flp pilus assembly protein TadD